ncbi:MAG: hypothetical protein ACI4MS_04135 [Candidatus Coproplasma sp.]
MKKFKSKILLCATVAVAITMGGTLAGCVTINEEDVKQVVSTVNISNSQAFKDEFGDYASVVTTESILKRDLLSAFLSTGYSYVQQGYSYADVFDLLSDGLVENSAVTQYATVYLLKSKCEDASSGVDLATFKSKPTEKEKLEYLLGGEDSKGVRTATYTLKYTLNNTLDSYEESKIKEEDDSYVGTDSRSTPTDVDTLNEDYIPENYNVYTGYNGYLLADAGNDYEPLNGTNRNTRRKAYSSFVSYLKNNYMLTSEDTNTTDIMSLTYVQDLYLSQLQQQVISEFSDLFEDECESIINTTDDDGNYTYIQSRYDKMLTKQSADYDESSSFETAMGNISDTSFILFSPDTSDSDVAGGTYGYVYNILLPFSNLQESRLKELQYYRDNNDSITESKYFADRNKLLKNITSTDQRGAWFNGTKDYSFNVSEYNTENEDKAITYYNGGNTDRNYLFFENNLTKTDKYEPLDKYIGLYSYNGKVIENKDGSYTLIPKKIDIDGMLEEFKAYVNFVLGGDKVTISAGDSLTGGDNFSAFYSVTDFTVSADSDDIDYSKLVYATGKIEIDNLSDGIMFDKTSARYKAMSAVNELQYAYTTDPGILSEQYKYLGYSVSAYDTSFIKEFEYSAQQAITMGVGAFKVCAGDYGWHLIYVTDTFKVSATEEYTPVFTVTNIEKEGTFENRFYTWIKDADMTDEAELKRSEIIREFVNDSTVKTDKKVYKDLAELDS